MLEVDQEFSFPEGQAVQGLEVEATSLMPHSGILFRVKTATVLQV